VAGQARTFATTEVEDDQIAAVLRIIELRENELAILREVTAEKIRTSGLETATFDRSESFREQREAVERSLLSVKNVKGSVSASEDSGISREFARLNEQIDAAKLKLSQGIRSENLIDVTDASQQIQRLSDQLDALRIKADSIADAKSVNRGIFNQFSDEDRTLRVGDT
jgi:hypothetical protein